MIPLPDSQAFPRITNTVNSAGATLSGDKPFYPVANPHGRCKDHLAQNNEWNPTDYHSILLHAEPGQAKSST